MIINLITACFLRRTDVNIGRFNTGYEDGHYSMVAGHVDPQETFTQCICRESKEEAGILLNPEDITVAHVMHRNSAIGENSERVDVFFTTKK